MSNPIETRHLTETEARNYVNLLSWGQVNHLLDSVENTPGMIKADEALARAMAVNYVLLGRLQFTTTVQPFTGRTHQEISEEHEEANRKHREAKTRPTQKKYQERATELANERALVPAIRLLQEERWEESKEKMLVRKLESWVEGYESRVKKLVASAENPNLFVNEMEWNAGSTVGAAFKAGLAKRYLAGIEEGETTPLRARDLLIRELERYMDSGVQSLSLTRRGLEEDQWDAAKSALRELTDWF